MGAAVSVLLAIISKTKGSINGYDNMKINPLYFDLFCIWLTFHQLGTQSKEIQAPHFPQDNFFRL